MITQNDIEKIRELKEKGYSQQKVANELKLSRSTVARHWSNTKTLELTLNDLFAVAKCSGCETIYPTPRFLPEWKCPYCKAEFYWKEPQFKPKEVR